MIDLGVLKKACDDIGSRNKPIKALLLSGSAGMHSNNPTDYDIWGILDGDDIPTGSVSITGPGLDRDTTINRMMGVEMFRKRCAVAVPEGEMWDLPFLFERRMIELPFEVLYVVDDFKAELENGVRTAAEATLGKIVYGFLGKELEERYRSSKPDFEGVSKRLHQYYVWRLGPSPKHYGKDNELTEYVDSVLLERERPWAEALYDGLAKKEYWWNI